MSQKKGPGTPKAQPGSILSYFNRTPTTAPVKSSISKNEVEKENSPFFLTPQQSKPTRKHKLVIESDDESDEELNIKQTKQSKSVVNHSTFAERLEKASNSPQHNVSLSVSSKLKRFSNKSDPVDEVHDATEENGDKDTYEMLPFLQPDRIMDAKSRKPSHRDYDSSTLFVPGSFLKDQTPCLYQWWVLKSQNFDTVLFFKMGKFYELFHMDAVLGMQELSIVRMKGEHAHAGFPEAAYDRYADQLLSRGYKIARIEQTETPDMMQKRLQKMARGTKFDKVVRREICQKITPGTRTTDIICSSVCADQETRYLFAIMEDAAAAPWMFSVTVCDCSTGCVYFGTFRDDENLSVLRTLFSTYLPGHVLLNRRRMSPIVNKLFHSFFGSNEGCLIQYLPDERWDTSTAETYTGGLPLVMDDFTKRSFSAMAHCLEECLIESRVLAGKRFFPLTLPQVEVQKIASGEGQQNVIASSDIIPVFDGGVKAEHLTLDSVCLANLEILPRADGAGRSVRDDGSLLSLLDSCATQPGSRLLKRMLICPPKGLAAVVRLQKLVKFFADERLLAEMTESVRKLPSDFERLQQKMRTFAQMIAVRRRASEDGGNIDMDAHPDCRAVLFDESKYKKRRFAELQRALEGFMACKLQYEMLCRAVEQRKCQTMSEFLKSYWPEHMRPAELEIELKGCLKLVAKSLDASPTDDMDQFGVFERFNQQYEPLSHVAASSARLDVLLSFARYSASDSGMCTPIFADSKGDDTGDQHVLFVEAGRHPALVAKGGIVIPNDVKMNCSSGQTGEEGANSDDSSVIILSGPNMGGKSTYLRKVGLLVVLAHLGCSVPAARMRLTPVDRIFTRLGASDDLLRGQSTFFVELSETATMLKHATASSLVLLDEFGRGTSTHDGAALAHALVGYLAETRAQRPRRCLVSTHYDLLNREFGKRRSSSGSNVSLRHMACREIEASDGVAQEIAFLYKCVAGPCPHSYGFNAARLANLPEDVISRGYRLASDSERLQLLWHQVKEVYDQ